MSSKKFTKIAIRIKLLRESFGLTKAAFAERVCISPAYVTDIEAGKKDNISRTLTKLVCYEFNINSIWLLAGEGPMMKKETPEAFGVNEAQPEYADRDEPTAGIPADYPLAKKLMAEMEDAARLGLTEEELTDLLMKILEGEMIKQRRRPGPTTEPVPEPPVVEPEPQSLPYPALLALIRRIVKEEIPPEGEPERRKCMFDIAKILRESDNIKGDISPETP